MLRKALFLFALLFVFGVSSEARTRVKLTKAMYSTGWQGHFTFNLCYSEVNIYGDPNVNGNNYADLSAYEALVVEVAEGTPRFLFNRVGDSGQAPEGMIDIPNNADQTDAYQTVEELGGGKKAYIIDLTKIKNDWNGIAHLNAIKSRSFDAGVIVTRMYLLRPEGENGVIADNEIRVTPRYTIGDRYLELDDLNKVPFGFAIVDDNKVLCIDDDTTHIEMREKTRVYSNVTDDRYQLQWRFKIENGLEDYAEKNFKLHHYDAYTDKFSVLGYACASPYKHLWMTTNENEPEERLYYDDETGKKENCLNGTNWMIEYAGNGEVTSVEQLRGLSGFYMISSDESKMANFVPERSNDAIRINNVQDVLNDASSYRYFTAEQMWGQEQYRIQAHNIGGEDKSGWTGTYLNMGNPDYFFMGDSKGQVNRVENPGDAADNGIVLTIRIGEGNDAQYLYGSGAQNCAMGDKNDAVNSNNAVIGFKLEKVNDVDHGYLLRAVTPNGGDYALWGASATYLNSQRNENGAVSFIYGLNGQRGQDLSDGAVWVLQPDGSIKNLGSGLYFNGVNMSTTPVSCSFVTIEKHDWGIDLDYGSLWEIEYENDHGFTFRNNGTKNSKMYYLGADGNISENPVYWRCFNPEQFRYSSDNKVANMYTLRSVGVAQGNYNVDFIRTDEETEKEVWVHNNVYDDLGYLSHRDIEILEDGTFKSREGWKFSQSEATHWRFREIVRTSESEREDKLIDDLVFALRHQIANEFNRYQCYDDAGQPSLTSNFEQEVKYALNYMYEDAQNCGGKNVYALADQLEYYNTRLRLVKPKVGDFIRMKGEKNNTYFSGSSSKATYDMLAEQMETVDGKEVVKDPGASTIFYYDAEGKLVNYSTGLVFGNSTEGDFAVKTELKENGDKTASTILFTDSRVTRFPADRDKETGAILRDSVQVAHTYSVYIGPTENDKVLIAKKGTSAHVAYMGFPKPGVTGNYDSETEIILTKVVDLPISISPAGYATFCCPQDADLITEGAKAYIGKVNDEMSKVTFITMPENGTRIPANTPVLIEQKGGKTVYARVRTTGEPYPAASGAEQNSLVGKYYTVSYTKVEGDDGRLTYDGFKAEKQAIDSHVYTLTGDGVWKFYTGSTLAGFKAKIKLKDIDEYTKQVKTFAFTFDDMEADDETSIQIAKELGVKTGNGVMYNLAGQRVISPRKGVYVQDGKKVMVK